MERGLICLTPVSGKVEVKSLEDNVLLLYRQVKLTIETSITKRILGSWM